jgi:hypothetical protein
MKLSSPTSQILKSIENNFSNQYKKIRENIALVAYSIIRGQKVMTREIARYRPMKSMVLISKPTT